MRKIFTLIPLFFIANVCVAQLIDNFSDGDFTVNPVWSGASTDYIVNGSKQLQLNKTIAGTSFLTTTFSNGDMTQFNVEWQVYVKQTFSPSSTNFGRVYLVSDQLDLTLPLNGYYLQFGEAGSLDAIELFRQSGTTRTSVCRATSGAIASSFAVRVKVLRSSLGAWQLYVDYTGGNTFSLESSGTDATHITSAYLGVECVYTITNANKFFFDDFLIISTPIPDIIPPTVQSISLGNSSTLEILLSEALDPIFANTVLNYTLNQGIGNPTSAILQSNNKTIRLTFLTPFKNGYQHELTISGIKDLVGNEIIATQKSFIYFVPTPVLVKDIIISEFFPDPSPVIGLPDQEFVEIYNRSKNPIDVAGWQLTDRSSTATLPSQIILPQEYWIITSSSGAALFAPFGKTLSVSNFPTLNNTGDKIILLDPTGLKVDSLSYNLKWYNNADKQEGGWTLELLNSDTLRYDSANWLASINPVGGTPGKVNSQAGKFFDQTPPVLINVSVVNKNQLILQFNEKLEQISTQTVTNYAINNQIGNPQIVLLSVDKKTITLVFQVDFTNGVINKLTIGSISDISGNIIQDLQKDILYFLPQPIVSKDIIITEIMTDPSPVIGLPDEEFIEIYNRSKNPVNLAGWKLTDRSSIASLPSQIIFPQEYWIVTSSSAATLFASFGKTLGVSNFPTLNNTGDKIILLDPTGLKVDSLSYNLKWYNNADKQEGGWTLELLNSDTLRYDSANWLVSIDPVGGTPGKVNSQAGKFFDQTPPVLISISVINKNQMQLIFNEKIEQLSAQMLTNYVINNQIGNPQNTSLSVDKKTITLQFQVDFKNGITNSLTIVGISDLSGNSIQNLQKDFLYFLSQPIASKDIIITEIMADPAPIVGLPEAEYIEIYNRSANPINLLDWTLSDGGSLAKFPSKIIQPNEYWIIHSSTTSQFNSYPNRIPLTSFPSLNNTSDSIVLKSPTSFTIDSVAYTSLWYRNIEKKDGGWSLELIDFKNVCGEENNWTASEDVKGGSPGKQNSVNANKPDLSGPKLLSLVMLRPNQLHLIFNEKLEKEISPASFLIDPTVLVYKVQFKTKALREIILDLTEALSSRQLYTITIKNLRDCNGNLIQDEFSTIKFAMPESAESLDILINEILFNPKPNGLDFVEIYNNSPKYINLKNWKLANIENDVVKNSQEITSGNYILAPFTYLALAEDPEIIKNNYLNNISGNFLKQNLPSFPDDEGSVVLINKEGKIIDLFLYNKTFHSSLIKDDDGVSLERISTQQPTQDKSNWKSATSYSGYATPGYFNSNARPETIMDETLVSIEPEVFNPNVGQFAKINFHFDQSSFIANVKIFDQQGRQVKIIANNESLNYDGFYRWDGDLDDGSKARLGYYVVWFEVFDANGFLKVFRKRVVVAGD